MSAPYDVVVAGLGGMGSAVLAQCALRGARVLGVERFERGHQLGASTGKTRIIRQAYYEDPSYVPLLLRAYELWDELERRTDESVMRLTGLLMAGLPENDVLAGSARAAKTWDLPVEYLCAAEIRARYPMLRVLDGEAGVYERAGGVVFPEIAVRAQLQLAERHGAETRFETSIESWQSNGDRVTVRLSDGTAVEAGSLVLALGPWSHAEFAALGVPFEVQRNVQVWFAPATHDYDAGAFPVFLLDRAGLSAPIYGFPDFGDGVKAAFHGSGAITAANSLDRSIDFQHDVEPLASVLETWMPGAAGRFREAKACMYSLTPDRHFVVDVHPQHHNVVLLGGFSGHGFKFASVIGETGADLALTGTSRHDIEFLSLRRFYEPAS